MRFFFIVQGEGRGHMTQALTLGKLLSDHNHTLTRVVIGVNKQRKIPPFFKKGFDAPVNEIEAPCFITNAQQTSVSLFNTLFRVVRKLTVYRKSINLIDRWVKEDKPDVIVNFYEFLGGIYNKFKKPKAQFICIAHQYFLHHPTFTFPKGRFWDKSSLKWGNKITSWNADKRLALSFRDEESTNQHVVVPPLLRAAVKRLKPTENDFILAYILYTGFADTLAQIAESEKVKIHCFWDGHQTPKICQRNDWFWLYRIDDNEFLNQMEKCSGFISTAGFESLCEARYLGKPVMMIPVKGHYEQTCNAHDAEQSEIGIQSNHFDLKKFLAYLSKHKTTNEKFKRWCDKSEDIILHHLTH